ncbi:MAG: hypothetical protein F4213_06930 [Boseongicola sp. SB0677_bin_26]|nr:hypothetical protein [Boseongicola sp. SB0665_bin_10]MYG25746.1 hypothetical protein [Boseongicola sp. SB0677_bin_26]
MVASVLWKAEARVEQALRAAAEPLLERGEQLRPRGRVLGGLLLIVADDFAARPLPVPAET